MKLICLVVLLFIVFTVNSQYKIEINSGNHSQIISADYDREKNQLIALDELGFVVTWDIGNFSIINKFQLPPENPFATTKRQGLGKYEIKAFDSIITVTYPENHYQTQSGERLVDLYNRTNGAFIMQTPIGKISSVAFGKDGTMFVAMSNVVKSGYVPTFDGATITRTDIKNKSISVELKEVPTTIELDDKKGLVAIGFSNGSIEIRNSKTLALISSFNSLKQEQEIKIAQLLFIPNSDNIAFVAEHSGNVMIHDTRSGKLVDSMNLEPSDYKLAVSPSGKYLTALWNNFYYVFLHDLQKKTTEKKLILEPRYGLSIFLSNVSFTKDDMLIGVGRNSIASGNIKTNGIGNVGAWLGLVDLKTNTTSANLNIATASAWMDKYGTQMLKNSALGTVLHGFADEYVYTDPSSFTLRSGKLTDLNTRFDQYLHNKGHSEFQVSALHRVGSNSAPDLADPAIAATIFQAKRGVFTPDTDSFFIAYYNAAADSFIRATSLIIPFDDAHNYELKGVSAKTGTSFFVHTFKNQNDRKATELLVYDEQGKRILQDTIVDTYSNRTIGLSPDHKYITYQSSPGRLIVRSLKDFSVVYTANTGFFLYGYSPNGYAYPQFLKAEPSKIVHETYKVINNNVQFCLVSTDIVKRKTDTLITFALRPVSYDLDSSGKKISLLFNYDFTDSSFNAESLQKALSQNFKTIFQPTAMIYDVQIQDVTKSVHTGKAGISATSINNNWLTVLQNDGQILYFNTQENFSKISQVLDGEAQALVADSFYYSSQKLLPLIRFTTSKRSFAANQADIFFNRPHDILKQFLSKQNELIKPFQLAYNKRLEQQQLTNRNLTSVFKNDEVIKIIGVAQSSINTDERELSLPFTIIGDKNSISKIRVTINGQPIFGRKGVDTKKLLAENKIKIKLNTGENLISIIPETRDGQQIDALKYYYFYEPKVYKSPKLYFLSAGVSDYKDSMYNLKYAAKDAADILQAFNNKVADTIISQVLVNQQVTKQNINAWAKQIEKTEVDDIVILYFAGHGLLDSKNDFYYAVHNMDFASPEKNGLSYESILDLLDKSPSRKKILLLDACHSGAFDRSAGKQLINAPFSTANVVNNEKRGFTIKGSKQSISESQAFVLMNQVFTDFSNDIGIDVIAASLGNSYALEKEDLQNGLFTYAMIRAVALGLAAGNEDETQKITMEQVKKYVEQEVKRLSRGEQIPSIRSSNVQSDQIEFYYSWKNYSEAFQQFLEKYK